MKIEFITESGGLNERSLIHIPKKEYVTAYKTDKNKALKDLNGIIEMFTSPACFEVEINQVTFEKIYEHFKSSKYNGLILAYIENDDGKIDLEISLSSNGIKLSP